MEDERKDEPKIVTEEFKNVKYVTSQKTAEGKTVKVFSSIAVHSVAHSLWQIKGNVVLSSDGAKFTSQDASKVLLVCNQNTCCVGSPNAAG